MPVTILIFIEIIARSKKEPDPKWQEVIQFTKQSKEDELAIPISPASNLPNKILVWVLAILGIAIGLLAIIDYEQRNILITFSILLLCFPTIQLIKYIYFKTKEI